MLHDPHMSEGGWRQQIHGGGNPVRVLRQLREDGEGVASTTCNDIVKNTALTPSAVLPSARAAGSGAPADHAHRAPPPRPVTHRQGAAGVALHTGALQY